MNEVVSYTFSDAELKALAYFFRQSHSVPDELYTLNSLVEKYIYENMTIDEAERFYSAR